MKVVALWTGGKDSSLACYKILKRGYDVAFAMTFIWDQPSLAHPLAMIKLQSEVLRIPFYWERVAPPYFEAYRKGILELKEEYGIQGVVTGDISYVDSFHGNWVEDVCRGTGVEVIKPLWDMDRLRIVEDIVGNGFKVIFTCVKEPWFREEWLGRTIDSQAIKELQKLNEETGMDICGENGEYHTMTIDAPLFKKAIKVSKFETEKVRDAYIMKGVDLSVAPKKVSKTNDYTEKRYADISVKRGR